MSEEQSTIEYRPITGFPGYRVGNDGSVWSKNYWPKDKWRRLKGDVGRGGYVRVVLRRDKKTYRKLIHVLVLESFVCTRPNGFDACHNDGNPANNIVGNLRWDTRVGNFADKKNHGTQCRGETHGRAKLTAAIVRSIRSEYTEKKTKMRDLAERHNVDLSTIADAIKKTTWSDVT